MMKPTPASALGTTWWAEVFAAVATMGAQVAGLVPAATVGAEAASSDPAGELVTNGSFEQGPVGTPIAGWVEVV